MQRTVIYGPPGTGKTTKLMDIVGEELQVYEPCDIAFVSFTKKGTYEGKMRARGRYGLADSDLVNFRTIHSMCFRELGAARTDMINAKDYFEFSKAMGMRFLGYYTEELKHNDDFYLFMETMEKANPAYFARMVTDMNMPKYRNIKHNYNRFKQQRKKKDFTDLLIEYRDSGLEIPVKVAIIDEAQDLSTLQWDIVDKAFSGCDRVYVAGDDDQCSIKGTRVLVEDYEARFITHKAIEDLVPGKDKVVCIDIDGYNRTGEVTHCLMDFDLRVRDYTGRVVSMETETKGFKTTVTADHHALYVDSKTGKIRETRADKLKPAVQELMDWNGNTDIFCTETATVEGVPVYSLNVEYHHNYFADGILTHNCIYEWSGADVERFMAQTGEKIYLRHSYRLPSVILDFSKDVIEQAAQRIDKDYEPKAVGGEVLFYSDVKDVPINSKSTWLLLSRNNCFLDMYRDIFKAKGYVYTDKDELSFSESDIKKIQLYERHRDERRAITGESDVILSRHLREDFSLEDPWHLSFSWPESKCDYAQAILDHMKKHGDLVPEPYPYTVSTIHGAKGGEADDVVILLDATRAIVTACDETHSLDAELRTLYVACTRAKKRLHIVYPSKKTSIEPLLYEAIQNFKGATL